MNTAHRLKIKVIIGSTRQGRFSEKPAEWVFSEIKKRDGVEAELLDLRDYPMPFFSEAVPPAMKKEPYQNEIVKKWTEKIAEADGFIIISPEYNHGYPAVLKNALDYVYGEWSRKAVGFVSYGSVSGARSVEQLRQVAIELQMAPIRSAVHLPADKWMQVFTGKMPANELFESSNEYLGKFFDDLLWWTNALKIAREKK
ncbi:MAG: NAD(P)H-dependent oxidoreductase [Parcubacteria group bacterium]|nr:NAD(P)H-dependent oxidoreductase [Parcubacteria group bacterium]MCR4342407.1 NAD(P)H-dependent oxidoreductase [Patescibacteria group bacterium]